VARFILFLARLPPKSRENLKIFKFFLYTPLPPRQAAEFHRFANSKTLAPTLLSVARSAKKHNPLPVRLQKQN
jgi:hypothetical protein